MVVGMPTTSLEVNYFHNYTILNCPSHCVNNLQKEKNLSNQRGVTGH